MNKWSAPYCGISHYGQLGDARRATIHAPMVNGGSWTVALIERGNGYQGQSSVTQHNFPSESRAKEFAEAWVHQLQQNSLTREEMFAIVDELNRFLEELEYRDVTSNDVAKFKRIAEGIF